MAACSIRKGRSHGHGIIDRSHSQHQQLGRLGAAPRFRYEVNNQYQTRWRELLMLHKAAHGDIPALNQREPVPKLGRLG